MRSRRVTGLVARSKATLADLRDLWDRFRRRSPRPRAFRPNGWTIAEVERAIRNQPGEWAYVFDSIGVQVVRRRGTKRGVTFSSDELPLMNDACLVHNHPLDAEVRPENLTFSRLDLLFSVRYNLAEARVVAGSWRFVIQRPATGWPADEDVVFAVYNEMRDRIDGELIVAVMEGRMRDEEREAILPHETVRRVAEWGRFTYHRETV
jgi:hypothetical protein